MDSLTGALEGKIDFEGQKLVEQISHYALITLTVISFLAGFASQSLQTTFAIFGMGTLLLAIVVLPPWPIYNQHTLVWAKPATSLSPEPKHAGNVKQ